MRIKVVLFDSGHTLMKPLNDEWFPGWKFDDILRQYGYPTGKRDEMKVALEAGYFEPYAETRDVLDQLHARAIPMGVITDAWPSVATKMTELGFHSLLIDRSRSRPSDGVIRDLRDLMDLI